MKVRDWAAKGYESEKVEISFKIWFDLIIKGTIDGGLEVLINTASDERSIDVELSPKLEVELTAGLELKAKVAIIKTAGINLKGELSASGKSGITFSNHIKYKTYEGLFWTPELILPPCEAKVVLMVEVGLYYKKISADWKPINYNETRSFWDKDIKIIKNVLGKSPKFQIIKP